MDDVHAFNLALRAVVDDTRKAVNDVGRDTTATSFDEAAAMIERLVALQTQLTDDVAWLQRVLAEHRSA